MRVAIYSPFQMSASGSGYSYSTQTDVDALSPALLYWDHVLVPLNTLRDEHMFMTPPDTVAKLRDSGIGGSYDVAFTDKSKMSAMSRALMFRVVQTFDDWRRPGHQVALVGRDGSVATNADFLKSFFGQRSSVDPIPEHGDGEPRVAEFHSVQISIERALPLPTKGVSLDDLLRFRSKRGEDLAHLQKEIAALSGVAIAAGPRNMEEAIRQAQGDLAKSIDEVAKMMDRTFGSRLIASVDVSGWDAISLGYGAYTEDYIVGSLLFAAQVTVTAVAKAWNPRNGIDPKLQNYMYAYNVRQL